MTRVRVVAGILRDDNGCVLIAERIGDQAFAGLWEFPGGKIRDGEASLSALKREIDEELGIEILQPTLFMSLDHDYPDRSVSIDFYLINDWSNTPEGRFPVAGGWSGDSGVASAVTGQQMLIWKPTSRPVCTARLPMLDHSRNRTVKRCWLPLISG
jgi:8-oxo-dGTP diphosphatase